MLEKEEKKKYSIPSSVKLHFKLILGGEVQQYT